MIRGVGVILLQALAMSVPAQSQAIRVSRSSEGTEANRESWEASVSPDGRYVAFISNASNLDPLDQDTCSDLFLHDFMLGTTALAGVNSEEQKIDSGYCGGGYGGERQTSSIRRPLIRGVASELLFFQSTGKNLDPGHAAGWGLFVRDLATGTTRLVDNLGFGAIDLLTYSASLDGRFLTYLAPGNRSANDRLLSVYLHDRATGLSQPASISADGRVVLAVGYTYVSDDGRFVTFASDDEAVVPGDTNRATDVFLRDVSLGTTRRVSVDEQGQQRAGPTLPLAMSPSGQYVVVLENADTLWLYDSNTGLGTLLWQYRYPSEGPARIWADEAYVSDSAQEVLFAAEGPNTIWSIDTNTRVLRRFQLLTPDGETAYISAATNISRGVPLVAFESDFPGFLANDTNNSKDIFVADLSSVLSTEVLGVSGGITTPDTPQPGLSAAGLACPGTGFVSMTALGLLGFKGRRRPNAQ